MITILTRTLQLYRSLRCYLDSRCYDSTTLLFVDYVYERYLVDCWCRLLPLLLAVGCSYDCQQIYDIYRPSGYRGVIRTC